jgi:hypothetical protein
LTRSKGLSGLSGNISSSFWHDHSTVASSNKKMGNLNKFVWSIVIPVYLSFFIRHLKYQLKTLCNLALLCLAIFWPTKDKKPKKLFALPELALAIGLAFSNFPRHFPNIHLHFYLNLYNKPTIQPTDEKQTYRNRLSQPSFADRPVGRSFNPRLL